jgi:hypothetical protein
MNNEKNCVFGDKCANKDCKYNRKEKDASDEGVPKFPIKAVS